MIGIPQFKLVNILMNINKIDEKLLHNFELINYAIFNYKNNNEKIKYYNFLISRFSPLLKSISRKLSIHFYASPLTYEDYFLFSLYAFKDGIELFDLTRETMFPSFIKKYITLKLLSYAKKYMSSNNKLMNKVASINNENEDQIISNWPWEYSDETKEFDLDFYITKIRNLNFLSGKEKLVLTYLLEGKKPKIIARLMETSTSAIYMHIKRAREKIRNLSNKFQTQN